MAEEKLLVKIQVDGKEAEANLGKFNKLLKDTESSAKSASSTVENSERSFSKFSSSIIAVNQALELGIKAFNALANAARAPVAAYIEQEKAEASMVNALKLTGYYTEANAQALKDYASALQDTTVVGDEVTLSMIQQALAMGRNVEQAKLLAKAAIDLSAATGKDVNTSFQQLIMTFTGVTRSLKMAGIDVSYLTEKQLQAGAAVEIVAKQFDGFAKAQTTTLAGALQQASNLFGDLAEKIGQVIVRIFELPSATSAIVSALTYANNAVAELGDYLVEMRDNLISVLEPLKRVYEALLEAFTAVNWSAVLEAFRVALINVAIAVGVSLIPPMIILAKTLALTLAPAFAAAALAIGGFLLKASLIVAAVGGVDIAIRNIGTTVESLSVLWNKFVIVLLKGIEIILRARISLGELFGSEMRDEQQLLLNNLSKQVETMREISKSTEVIEQAGFDFGILGTIVEQGTKAVQAFNVSFSNTAEAIQPVIKQAQVLGKVLRTMPKPIDPKLIDAALKAFEAFTKAQGTYGLNAREIAEYNYKMRLKEIDAMEEQLKLAGLLSGREQEIAKARKIAAETRAKAVTEAGPAPEFVAGVSKAIAPIGSMISGFGSVITGPIGVAQGVVTIAQGIVDIIPNLLNSVAKLFNSITDLPIVLLNAFVGLFKAIPRFISEFIPNILKMLPGIAEGLIEFIVEGIPNAFLGLVNMLPTLLQKFVDMMPVLIKRLTTAAIVEMPKLASGLIRLWFIVLPRLIVSIVKAIPDIVVAIVEGIWEGIKQLGNEIADLFKDIFSFGSVGDAIGEAVTDAGEAVVATVSRIGDETFKVMDLRGAAKGLDISKQISSAIEGAGTRGAGWIKQAWTFLSEGFTNVFKKIRDDFVAVFDFSVGLFKGAWSTATEVFGAIVNLFKGMWDSVRTIFDGIVTAFSGVWDIFKAVGNFVVNLFKDPIGAFKTLFDDVGAAFMKIVGGFKTMFDGVIKGIKGAFDFLGDIGSAIAKGFKDAISGIGNMLKNLFKFDGGGMGAVEKFLGFDFPFFPFAEGGVVPGRAKVKGDSYQNDMVPAMLSPGELVIPRSAVEAGTSGIQEFLGKYMTPDQRGRGGVKLAWGLSDLDITNKDSGIRQAGRDFDKGVLTPVAQAIQKLPQQAIDAANAIIKFGGSINWLDLIVDPVAVVKKALSGMSGFTDKILKDWIGNNVANFATGGYVSGYGTGDNVNARLTPGEYVLNRGAVASLGTGFLDRLNSGKQAQQSPSGAVTVNLTINTSQAIDENFIRSKLVPEIKKQLRRDSLDGRRVLNPAGVR